MISTHSGRGRPGCAKERFPIHFDPLSIQVATGTCESWGKIWMAPRFTDVTERVAERQRDYERALARWPEYQAQLARLFVLGE